MSRSIEKPQMRCTDCDLPMNRHAEKPAKSSTYGETDRFDSSDEAVVSIHSCPGCGKVGAKLESRE